MVVDIIVAALQPEVRAALQSRLAAGGLGAAHAVDSPRALEEALSGLTQPLVVAGVHWPETAPFLDRATALEIPVALLLEEPFLDDRHSAFRRGAAGLLPWPTPTAPLASALAALRYGFRVVPGRPAAEPASLAPFSPLSARERELLELVAGGLSNKAIARELGVSINTVKYHLASVFTKLDARTRAEAVSAAARRGELML